MVGVCWLRWLFSVGFVVMFELVVWLIGVVFWVVWWVFELVCCLLIDLCFGVIVLFEFGVLWFWFLMVFVCLFFVGVGSLHCLVMVYVITRV